MRKVILMLLILLLAGVPVANDAPISEDKEGIEWIEFDLPKDTIRNFVGHLDESISLEERPLIAHSRIGIHDTAGTLFDREIPAELLVSRPDLSLFWCLRILEFQMLEIIYRIFRD